MGVGVYVETVSLQSLGIHTFNESFQNLGVMLLFCMDIHISLVFVLDRLLFQFLNVFYLNRSTATVPINACNV